MSQTKNPSWLYDEYQDFGFSNLEEIAAYEKKSGADPADEREFLKELGVSREHTLIDFGCGTGVLALEAAKLCKKVYAVDVSAPMLDYMRSKAERQGIHNVGYFKQGFLSYEHRDEPVDFIITVRALHHLPDFWKVQALERMSKMLKSGGTFYLNDLVYSFEPQEAESVIENWMSKVLPEAEGGFPRSFFEEHVREEYSTYSWLLEAMLDKTGFDIKEIEYSDLKTYARYTCIKR